jgi:hypothetical protein
VNRERCLLVVPYVDRIDGEAALRQLEAAGYAVRRCDSHANIDLRRSELATRALAEGFDEILWIDSDMTFEPAAVDQLRAHGLPLVGAVYAKRGGAALTCTFLEGTDQVTLGEGGGLLEVRHAATGFLLTHRRVYEDIAAKFDLPVCNAGSKSPVVPYFLPMVIRDPQMGPWYMSEDWSFCERARQAGHRVMVDTSLRVWHVGRYAYGWEDVGAGVKRSRTVDVRLTKR